MALGQLSDRRDPRPREPKLKCSRAQPRIVGRGRHPRAAAAHRGRAGPARRRRRGPQSLPGRHQAPGRPPRAAELSPEASSMTDIGALSSRVRARRCDVQRRRLRRAPLARPDRRACREAVRHTSFCTHTAERWLPARTAAAMCPVFGGHLQQRSAQRHPRPPDRARLAGGRFRCRQEEALADQAHR